MRRLMGVPVAAVLLTACVTINVYFPAAEAKEAAKEFVEKVIGDEAQATRPSPPMKTAAAWRCSHECPQEACSRASTC